ncbi:MAG TPA: prepilin-type N-terminal cleavage/methylation domain-containing protein [Rubrobacteraceae bacterium]|nr:prepilin-type N-terminal cleavage/methylation domain-containing protein [Rubrobacteraceae bacterium]
MRGNERGFTLPEVLVTIAILGILIAVAIIIWLGLLEQRRVDAATNQLVADLRLAHSSASNQLTDWRVVLNPEKADESGDPDYYMVKLAQPYDPDIAGNPSPAVASGTPPRPRHFPANVKIVNINGNLDSGSWIVAPSQADKTRTLEFNSDGTMRFYQAVSGSTCVTVDGDPQNRVVVLAATSRVKVKDGAC